MLKLYKGKYYGKHGFVYVCDVDRLSAAKQCWREKLFNSLETFEIKEIPESEWRYIDYPMESTNPLSTPLTMKDYMESATQPEIIFSSTN